MSDELRELRSNRDIDMHSVRNAHAEELLLVQTKASDVLEKTRESYQEQLNQLRSSSDLALKTATEKISDLETLLSEEKAARTQSDYQCRDLLRSKDIHGTEKDNLVAEAIDIRQALRQSETERGK
jgi:hypothetical protein